MNLIIFPKKKKKEKKEICQTTGLFKVSSSKFQTLLIFVILHLMERYFFLSHTYKISFK